MVERPSDLGGGRAPVFINTSLIAAITFPVDSALAKVVVALGKSR